MTETARTKPDDNPLAALQRRATEQGFRCLTEVWSGYNARCLFECRAGHRFDRAARKLIYGRVRCAECWSNAIRERSQTSGKRSD